MCKADVTLKNNKIVCNKCRRAYPIKEGIPIMLVEEAEIEEKEKE